jgi:sugar phosphate isomerase/epimerase
MKRRQFIQGSALALGAALTRPLSAEVPFRSRPAAHIKLSCNCYSFNRLFREGTMAAEDMIDFCGTLPFDAIDLTGYYLGTYPAPPARDHLFALKKRALRLGLDISGTGVRNDFTSPDESDRHAALAHVREWARVAADLDAPMLRVFTGRPANPEDREKTLARVADCLLRCCDYAGEHGVMIVLQNHNELLHTAGETLELLERARHPWLGLCLDVGSLRQADPYEEIARLAPHAVTWQVKEKVYRKGEAEDLDMGRLVRIMREAGYRGYAPLEVLGSEQPLDDLAKMAGAFRKAMADSR